MPRLASRSPLFGPSPSALVLLECNLASQIGGSASTTIEDISDSIASVQSINRATVAFGGSFFDRFRMPRPSRLTQLRFNFDPGDDRLDRSDRDLVFALETSHADLGDALRVIGLLEKWIEDPLLHVGLRLSSNRDHLGFIDGTSNLQELTPAEFEQTVFVQDIDDPQFAGGTYIVLRKYREEAYFWHELPPNVQEQFIGRKRETGAFLDGRQVFTEKAWQATPALAHIRCANPRVAEPGRFEWRERMFRRSIPYTTRSPSGDEERGLLFLALARDPCEQVERLHNVRMQPKSGRRDLLLSSGYAVPLRSTCYYFRHPPDAA